MAVPTKKGPAHRLHIPSLPTIHITHPEIGRALQNILDYINLHVVPQEGNKVIPK